MVGRSGRKKERVCINLRTSIGATQLGHWQRLPKPHFGQGLHLAQDGDAAVEKR